jgi:ADP-ribosylation factor-like protein 2
MGASLLVFKNKSDVAGCLDEDEIREVCSLDIPSDKVLG